MDAPQTSKGNRKSKALQFRVPLEGKPDRDLQIVAYAFDAEGNVLASAPVKDERVALSLSESQIRHARLFLGPPMPEGRDEAPTLQLMERVHAYEPVWRFDPQQDLQVLRPIPEIDWQFWWWCWCRVRGQVVRPITSNGITVNLPVCHARVHICEVDRIPRFIFRLPDDMIFRLRDELLRELLERIPRPFPIPDPPPFRFDPGVIDPSPENVAKMNRARRAELAGVLTHPGELQGLNPQPLPPKEGRFASAINRVALNPQPLPPKPSPVVMRGLETGFQVGEMQRLDVLPPDTRSALLSSSSTLIRNALIQDFDLILPYLCRWNWLWWYFRCDEVAVVETGDDGRFDTTIYYSCPGDHPDLYFWVEYDLGGTWTTVYRPSIPCNTYWDYGCGEEVTLRVTDPRVGVCYDPPDLPGLQVAVMSIGNGVSISEIQGAAAGAAEGLTTGGRPFGGRLEPHVIFSRAALIGVGITHYRWSYRRLTQADGTSVSDAWHALTRQVIRHYGVITPTPPDFPLTFLSDVLGPDPAFAGQNLFRIQPVDPSVVPGTIGIGWSDLDAREDSATAFFLTHLLEEGDAEAAAGKYELKLELFRSNGTQVNLTDAGVLFKEASDPAPFGPGTVNTQVPPEEHLIKDGANKVVGFRVVIHVDNNPCEAVIYPVDGTGLNTDTVCGFVEYAPGASADLSFRAYHPNNFATFSFGVWRATSVPVAPANASGAVGANPVDGYTRDSASVFTKSIPVTTLLTAGESDPSKYCTQAAFATYLHVDALATDGWGILEYLDDSAAPVAFALEPAPTP